MCVCIYIYTRARAMLNQIQRAITFSKTGSLFSWPIILTVWNTKLQSLPSLPSPTSTDSSPHNHKTFLKVCFNAIDYTSFTGNVCTSDNQASNGWMSNKSEVIWKNWDITYFKALFQFKLTDWENLTKINQDIQYLEQGTWRIGRKGSGDGNVFTGAPVGNLEGCSSTENLRGL
jgi:hypothetical protein